jgi:hypothetical protein
MENITNKIAFDSAATMRQWRAVDGLIENAPINCTKITLEITSDGHSVQYFAPSPDQVARFSWKSVHGEWIK